ncbi:hypothetical protein AB0H57_21130 [Micromonospora sp. NPDC050686]
MREVRIPVRDLMDSAAAQRTLGIAPTPLADALAATVAALR